MNNEKAALAKKKLKGCQVSGSSGETSNYQQKVGGGGIEWN